jgi:DNA-binding transcriptional regulator LsrR (DeoR family)
MILPADAREISASFKHIYDKEIAEAMEVIETAIIRAVQKGRYSTTVHIAYLDLSLDQLAEIKEVLKRKLKYELLNDMSIHDISFRWNREMP